MKYYPRLNVYKASNNFFNPVTCEAYSYNWWRYVERIGNKVIFNNYRYSVSTSKHQTRMQDLLTKLGINIDVTVECPRGLQDLESGIKYYNVQIQSLWMDIQKPNTKLSNNIERVNQINLFNEKIAQLKQLIAIRDKE